MTTVLNKKQLDRLAGWQPPKRKKYGNTRIQHDGIWFDSIRERDRYLHLKLLEKAGKISHLELQPVFKLFSGTTPVRYPSGRQAIYRADFAYFDYDRPERQRVIEDVKGVRTAEYKLKKAFVEACYPGVKIVEV